MRTIIDNQRIGERATVAFPAKLQPVRNARSFLRRGPRPVPAVVTDLSVSGAEVESRRLSLEVRDRARIITDEGVAVVEIRRVERIDRKRVSYGVRFLAVDPDLTVRFNQAAVGGRGDEIDWRWSTAR